MKRNRKNKKKVVLKVTQEHIKLLEQEYWARYNTNIPQWQQEMY